MKLRTWFMCIAVLSVLLAIIRYDYLNLESFKWDNLSNMGQYTNAGILPEGKTFSKQCKCLTGHSSVRPNSKDGPVMICRECGKHWRVIDAQSNDLRVRPSR